MGSKFRSQSSLSGYPGVPALYQVMCELAEYLHFIYSGMLSVLSPTHKQIFKKCIYLNLTVISI